MSAQPISAQAGYPERPYDPNATIQQPATSPPNTYNNNQPSTIPGTSTTTDDARQQLGQAGQTAQQRTGETAQYGQERAQQGAQYGQEKAQQGAQYAQDKAGQTAQYTQDKAGQAAQYTQDKAGQTAQYTQDKAGQAAQAAQSGAQTAQQKAQQGAQVAQEKAGQAAQTAQAHAQTAQQKAAEAARVAQAKAVDVANQVRSHPAVLQAQDTAGQYAQRLDKELGKYPIANDLSDRTGVPKVYLAAGTVGILSVLITFNTLALPTSNFIGWALPAYLSLGAIESRGHADDTQWLTYWVIFGFLQYLESFALPIVLHYVRWYFAFKTVFLLWLQLPATQGARRTYHAVIAPALSKTSSQSRTAAKYSPTTGSALRNGTGSNHNGTTNAPITGHETRLDDEQIRIALAAASAASATASKRTY